MRKHLILTAAAALTMGGSALAAEGPSYNFVQGGLVGTSSKVFGDSESGTGLGTSAEADIWEFLYGFGDVSAVKYSPDGGDTFFSQVSLGVGAHMPLGPVSGFAGVSLERLRVKVDPDGPDNNSSDTDSGVGLTAGVRGVLAEKFQWSGSVKYRDLDDFDSAVAISVSGHYYFRPNMAGGIVLTRNNYKGDGPNENIAFVNFRYDFSDMRR